MSADVDHILAERSQRAGRGPEAASLAAAVAIHALLVAVVLLLPRLTPPPKPLEFVPVTVIPAQALGVHRPAPPRRAAPQQAPANEEPAPKPAEPAPAPEAKPKPHEEEPPKPAPKTAEKVPVLPEKVDKKKPEPVKPSPAAAPALPAPATKATKKPDKTPPVPDKNPGKATGPAAAGRGGTGNPNSPPNATAEGETGDQAGRRGGASGTPLGTTAFGSHLAGVDNPDFTYGYYLDRLLSLIDANWVRPALGNGVRATISFHIQRDGTLTDLKVAESSGYQIFDLAAQRAVQNASPFPPLPKTYADAHHDLGVHLIVY